MSKTLTQADEYIAAILGGQNSTVVLLQARDALAAAMEDLTIRHQWAFLRQDTSQTFTVVSSASSGVATMTTVVTNGFKNVLVGMTVSGTNVAAGTTVSAIASNTSLTLSAVTTGAISSGTITFGGTIPIIAGTSEYKLPFLFHKPYDCRLITNTKMPLQFVQQNLLDSISMDQTVQGQVIAYTLYNSTNFDANGTQQGKIRFFRVPAANDTALLKFYRPFDVTLDPVDCSDRYIFVLLDLARVHLLRSRDATNARLPLLENRIETRINAAVADDTLEGGEDQYEGFLSPNEMIRGSAFEFYPRGDS